MKYLWKDEPVLINFLNKNLNDFSTNLWGKERKKNKFLSLTNAYFKRFDSVSSINLYAQLRDTQRPMQCYYYCYLLVRYGLVALKD